MIKLDFSVISYQIIVILLLLINTKDWRYCRVFWCMACRI